MLQYINIRLRFAAGAEQAPDREPQPRGRPLEWNRPRLPWAWAVILSGLTALLRWLVETFQP